MTINEGDLGIVCDGFTAEKCTSQAYYVLSGHLLDGCKTGKLGLLLCPHHTAALLQQYTEMLPTTCKLCQQKFEKLHELIEVSPLVKGAGI